MVSHIAIFFQAEDGIRDLIVTGVQTVCSSDLPIGFRTKLLLSQFRNDDCRLEKNPNQRQGQPNRNYADRNTEQPEKSRSNRITNGHVTQTLKHGDNYQKSCEKSRGHPRFRSQRKNRITPH